MTRSQIIATAIGAVVTAGLCLAFYQAEGTGGAIAAAVLGGLGMVILWLAAPGLEARPRQAPAAPEGPRPLWRRVAGFLLKMLVYYLVGSSAIRTYGWVHAIAYLLALWAVVLLVVVGGPILSRLFTRRRRPHRIEPY